MKTKKYGIKVKRFFFTGARYSYLAQTFSHKTGREWIRKFDHEIYYEENGEFGRPELSLVPVARLPKYREEFAW